MSLQDLQQNDGNGGSGELHMGHSHFDPTSSHDYFLERILSSVPSSSPWSWNPHHHNLFSLPLSPHNPSSDDDQSPPSNLLQSFHYDDQASSLLVSKIRYHQIIGGGGGATVKALMLQHQLLLNRLRSPTGSFGTNKTSETEEYGELLVDVVRRILASARRVFFWQ
ncbi:hypothetical protein K7X08_029917 [Anisodus acutangulus]|uniref:Uncharacterized protein n=1 Tax=Anisodus acutangulus TaxID=402998 RepID=A0A9Q1LJN3_9SOLA|nr:hypothetical protein K7X08_029917 [Anisodus acutangulus]